MFLEVVTNDKENTMKLIKCSFFFVGLLFIEPFCSWTPSIPLAQLFAGAFLFGSSTSNIVYSLCMKAFIFAFFARSLFWGEAVVLMLLASVVSLFVSVCLSYAAMMPLMILFFLPVMYLLAHTPAQRLTASPVFRFIKNQSVHAIAMWGVYLFVATWLVFGMAQMSYGKFDLLYLMLRVFYVYGALVLSIGLTTLWEEWAIAGLWRKRLKWITNDHKFQYNSFLYPVFKANVISLLIVMVSAALIQLQSPGL